jgi:glutaredoxin 3
VSPTLTVYITKPSAPLCTRVCDFLDSRGYTYDTIEVVSDADREAMQRRTGRRTCPLVLVDDQLIGQLEETIAAERSGRLAQLLAN